MATKRKLTTIAKPVKQSTKIPTSTRIDESRTSVSTADILQSSSSKPVDAPIEISSDSESDYDDISDLDEDDDTASKQAPKANNTKTKSTIIDSRGDNIDTEMKDESPDAEDSEAEDGAAPTFGDLIRTHETVDVPTSLEGTTQKHVSDALTTAPPRQIAPAPSPSSLGIVLAQALRTDDADLLESCLQVNDATTIRNTIQRLDSGLAGTLLTQLASRLHRRPGRAHNLMTFVQWTLIAHGGALTTQPDIQKRLSELNRVLEERAKGLNSLLALKGKLDMLEAQMTLRRGNKTRRGRAGKAAIDSEDDEADNDGEEGIVYVEGEENEPTKNGLPLRHRNDEDDDFPVANGVGSDSDDDSDANDEDDMEVDEMAEESLDEDEVDHDDVDSGEDESEAETAPPAKVQKKAASSFSKKR